MPHIYFLPQTLIVEIIPSSAHYSIQRCVGTDKKELCPVSQTRTEALRSGAIDGAVSRRFNSTRRGLKVMCPSVGVETTHAEPPYVRKRQRSKEYPSCHRPNPLYPSRPRRPDPSKRFLPHLLDFPTNSTPVFEYWQGFRVFVQGQKVFGVVEF